MPRLLYVVNDAPSFVSRRLRIAVAARAAGYEVHVATPEVPPAGTGQAAESFHDFPPERAVAEITGAGLQFHGLSLTRRGTNPFGELATVTELTRLYRRLRPSLVHHFTMKPILYGTLAARLNAVPAVLNSFVGLGYLFQSNSRFASVGRRLILLAYGRLCDRRGIGSVFQNQDDAAIFQAAGGIRQDRIKLIRGSGVDLQKYRPAPEAPGPPVVLLASRMLWDKGIGEFVQAATILRDEGVGARFVLAGGRDPDNPACISQEQLDAWVRSGVVEWLGQRNDMPALLTAAHVVCLPSYREGVPRILLEAAASGRAIVTTAVSGCREVVRPGRNGYLVPARDGRALAEAIGRLLHDPAERRRMGAEARLIAEAEFGLDQVVQQTLSLYRELLDTEVSMTSPTAGA